MALLLAAAAVLTVLAIFREDDPEGGATDTVTTVDTSVDNTTTALSSSTSTTASTTTAIATSTTATTSATTTTLADPLSALALNPTGIGDIAFGIDDEETVAQLTLVLGSPNEDTGWDASFETCPGTEARVVRWISLRVFFTNGATDWAPEGTRHFFHYGQSTLAGGGELIDLRTSTGIGINSTLGELEAEYGDGVTIVDDPVFGPFWEVDVAGAGVLWGTAGSIGDNGMIDSINGGSGCGE